MHRADPAHDGFSLMEVTTAIGVISFALVALLGVFPLGLDNSRLAVNETRAAQISKMVFSTLASELSTSTTSKPTVKCFGSAPLDLPADGTVYGDAVTVADLTSTLAVSYDPLDQPQIVRTPPATANAIYQIELTFHPKTFSYTEAASPTNPGLTKKRIIGYDVRLKFSGPTKTQPFFETSEFIPSFRRAAYLK